MSATKFFDKSGNTVGHVVQPEDRIRITCNGRFAHESCGNPAMLCEYGTNSPSYFYHCQEHSSLPERFARGDVSIILNEKHRISMEIDVVGLPDLFVRSTKGRRLKQYAMSHNDAVNYIWGVAQTEGINRYEVPLIAKF